MAREQPINVWNEIRVSGDGIGITLYSESAGDMPIVEDETWLTHEELQGQHLGEIIQLRLSDETRSAMSRAEVGQQFVESVTSQQSADLPQVGDLVRDLNAPSWADEDRLSVKEVTDTRADEYVLNETAPNWMDADTVATANPSYDADEPVVIAEYLDGSDEYAFPAERLEVLE